MVRVTGFEPAVSAPPAQRFTGLSYTLLHNYPPKTVESRIIPAYAQGGFSHTLIAWTSADIEIPFTIC